MTSSAWEPVRRALDPAHLVVRCDLRGQLRTPGPPPAEVDGHLDDLERLLEQTGLDRFHVLGTSFGAMLGLRLAERHPNRIASVVAATVAAGPTPRLQDAIARWAAACDAVLAGADRDDFYRTMADDLFSPSTTERAPERVHALAHQIRRLPERWFSDLKGLLDTAARAELEPSLPRISAPVLVVAAADDRIVPPDDAARLAHALPRARFELVPRSGHALVLERPRELAKLGLSFFAEPPLEPQ